MTVSTVLMVLGFIVLGIYLLVGLALALPFAFAVAGSSLSDILDAVKMFFIMLFLWPIILWSVGNCS